MSEGEPDDKDAADVEAHGGLQSASTIAEHLNPLHNIDLLTSDVEETADLEDALVSDASRS
jgi:hypothetical protein